MLIKRKLIKAMYTWELIDERIIKVTLKMYGRLITET